MPRLFRCRAFLSLVLPVLVVAGLAASGCGQRPEQAVEVYTRNDSQDEVGYFARPATDPELIGVISGISGGCVRLPRPWNLVVFRGPPQLGPDHVELAIVTSLGYPADGPAVVWISVAQDGTVETGHGIPGWWNADLQHCT